MRVRVYIDGYNLYYGIKATRKKELYWLDLHALCTELCQRRETLDRIFYFTARVSDPPDKTRRQARYIDALSVHCDIEFVFGQFRSDQRNCRSCHEPYPHHEEKMTDVNIATRLLVDAFEDRFDRAIVLSADSDLRYAIEEARRIARGKAITCVFPPHRGSKSLREVASDTRRLRVHLLERCLLPNPVVRDDGYLLSRPETWQAEKK